MPRRERPSSRRLRSTMDSVLIHDVKNVGQRLTFLLSNLEEHYGDPEFKRSVVELLSSTLEKLDTIATRCAAHQELILVKESLDLNELLADVLRSVTARGGDGRAHVVAEPGAVAPVWGDRHYLRDGFSSLVQNALEAAGANGTVRVRTGTIRAGRRRWAAVEIEDDGPGMPEEFVRERLFRPFQTTKADGVGLGLYTARQIFRFHGGDVEVTSKPGEGTLVKAILPAAGRDAR